MSSFRDGPAAGQALMIRRAPFYLRVVIGPRGKLDALDQPDDQPEPGETIHVYRRVTEPAFVCVRSGKGRGCFRFAEYEHVPDVDGETMRETGAWQAWAETRGRAGQAA